ncbi:MAG TPA: HisA/HisF-related TIM barrel protein, partial [Planctomycetota bacterium]|nr:HisA/HisF-related TIM barrel protein [Planctomycetota bacterium]
MIVFPALDLWNGQVVKLEAKQHRSVETVYGTPAEIADRWLSAGAEWLHVVDLNAALGEGSANLPVLKGLISRGARRIQWGGG